MTMLWWVVESSVRLTLLAGLVAAFLWALRVKSADTRLAVWSAVIASSFFLPFLPDQWIVPAGVGLAAPVSSPLFVDRMSAASATGGATGPGLLPAVDVVALMGFVYAAGVVTLLARLALGWSWASRLSKDASPVADQPFCESALVHVPVTVGLFAPRIVVPPTWREWPADMLTAVLAHESAHAARRDGMWLTLALIHRAVHWVNPLSWWIPGHLASLSERASDDAALTRGIAPVRYAEILLSFAGAVATRQRRVAWVLAMARPTGRDTERRLDRVLSWKGRVEMSRSRIVVLVLVLMSGSAAVYTAGVAPAEMPAAPVIEQSGETTRPVLLQRINPMYTPDARRAGIEGMVELQIVIDNTGAVADAKIIKSLDSTFGLDDAALATVRKWRFRPATINGAATPFTAIVQMEYRLEDAKKADATPEPKVAVPAVPQKAEPVVVQPVVTKRVDPKYTAEAMRQKIQGQITLLVAIDAKGVVTGATVAESLDAEHGLDTNAIDAVMQWSFLPGTVDGVAKPFSVKVTMEFRLH